MRMGYLPALQAAGFKVMTTPTSGVAVDADALVPAQQHAIAVAPMDEIAPWKRSPTTYQERALRYFVRFLSTTLKLSAHKIDPHAAMETYGIDSIMVLDLTRALESSSDRCRRRCSSSTRPWRR
jgi:hypothetical protein